MTPETRSEALWAAPSPPLVMAEPLAARPKRAGGGVRRWLAWGLYAALALLLFRFVDGRELARVWTALSGLDLLLVLAVSLLHIGLRALRYHALVRRVGPDATYRWWDGARVFLVGLSASAVTPGRVGDFVKTSLLESYGVSRASSFALVVVERLLDLLVIVSSALVFAVALPTESTTAAWRSVALILLVPVFAVVVSLTSSRGRDLWRRLTRALLGGSGSARGQRAAELVETVLTTMGRVLPSPGRALVLFGGSVLVWAVEFAKLGVVLALLGSSVPLSVVMFVYPVSILAGIAALVPASEGVIGLTGVALLGALAAVPAAVATTGLLVDRAASTAPPLVLAAVWSFWRQRRSAAVVDPAARPVSVAPVAPAASPTVVAPAGSMGASSKRDVRALYARVRAWQLRYGHWLLALTCWPALVHAYRLGSIMASRFDYPMDLEWMEGGLLVHADRLLRGQGVYVTPNEGFMPYPYPPLHFALLAALGWVVGLDYGLARCVSIAATLTAAALLTREVFRQFRGLPLPGVWAALALGAVAAGFPVTGGWYDIARNDALAAALSVLAAVLLSEPRELGPRRLAAAIAVLLAAVFTKQTCVFFGVWLVLYVFLSAPRRGLVLALAVALGGAAILGLLVTRTEGQYWYYTVALLQQHEVIEGRALAGWRTVVSFAPYLPVLPVVAAALAWFGGLSRRSVLWSGMLLAALPAGLLPYAKVGGFDNNFFPIVVLAGPTALCLLGDLLRDRGRQPLPTVVLLSVAAAWGFYLEARLYPTARYRVDASRRAAAEQLNAMIRELRGGVLIPHHPFLATRNGHTNEQVHAMPWYDARMANVPKLQFAPFLERTRPAHVLLMGDEEPLFLQALAESYRLREVLPASTERAETLTPGNTRLRFILERNEPEPPRRCLFDFEATRYAGWTKTGQAFGSGPTRTKRSFQSWIVGAEGRRLANSYSARQRDAATGRLRSPEFTIEEPRLSLRVGGGASAATRVELSVDGRVVFQASGRDCELLREVVWDVQPFLGKAAQLSIVDEAQGGWGHILVDHVCWAR